MALASRLYLGTSKEATLPLDPRIDAAKSEGELSSEEATQVLNLENLQDPHLASNASESATAPPNASSDRMTALPIGVAKQGNAPRFADETELLLKGRLRAAALDLTVVLGIGYVGNWISGSHQWLWFRSLILLAVIASYIGLKWLPAWRMRSLRGVEAVLFGGVALQMGLMMYSRIIHFAERGEATSMVGVQQFFFTAFCLHILTYGIFMPNTWRRGAVVMTSLALVPYAIWYLLLASHENVALLQGANRAGAPLPTTLIAALIGTYGSHIIHRTRREAFQARQIMQYRLQEPIGSGGMGEVYRAEHVLMKRPVAMKLIRADQDRNASTLNRFEREVIATAKLSHWNTIDIYDYGHTDDGTFYYVMELLEGSNLQSIIERYGVMPPSRVIYLLAQACDALEEAHNAGLIHRDIKPANIFASHRGGKWDVCKVLDFGLVKETSDPTSAAKAGTFAGTPMFMAPEQATRFDEVDGRTDLYAIGAVAYYLLAGRPPFQGQSTMDFIVAHATTPPIPIRQYRPELSEALEKVILTCLEKVADYRFKSAGELAKALRDCPEAGGWNAELAEQWWNRHASAEDFSGTTTHQGVGSEEATELMHPPVHP